MEQRDPRSGDAIICFVYYVYVLLDYFSQKRELAWLVSMSDEDWLWSVADTLANGGSHFMRQTELLREGKLALSISSMRVRQKIFVVGSGRASGMRGRPA